jgi:hypothetical protein
MYSHVKCVSDYSGKKYGRGRSVFSLKIQYNFLYRVSFLLEDAVEIIGMIFFLFVLFE